MAKLIPKIVVDNPNVIHIELGAGCGKFCAKYYPISFLTDLNDPQRDCEASNDPLYFKANANEISNYVPNNVFELVVCCNPYEYGFKTKLDAFTLLEQFNHILVPDKGKIKVIGAKKSNPHFNTKKISRFIEEFNLENSTKFAIVEEKDLNGMYPGFVFTDKFGKRVVPNTEIIISN